MADSISHDFEVVDIGGGGSYFTSTFRSVSITLIENSLKSDWLDEVGSEMSYRANNVIENFRKNTEIIFNNLVKMDKSISLEDFQYNGDEIDKQIESMKIKY